MPVTKDYKFGGKGAPVPIALPPGGRDPKFGRGTIAQPTQQTPATGAPNTTAGQGTPNVTNNPTNMARQAAAQGRGYSSVSERLQDLSQAGGAYLTQARQQGLDAAASRGLADSSIAAQASQAAALQAALPIAQQESQQEQQRAEAQAQRDFQGRQTSANLQGQYSQQVQQLLNQYAISINEIETAQNISTADKNNMIRNSIARRDADLKFMRQLYNALPTWQPNWSALPSFPSTPGVGG